MKSTLKISEIKERLSKKLLEFETAKSAASLELKQLKESKQLLRRESRAQVILQEVAERVQNTAHRRIAGLVSKCLSSVFDRPYQLKIEFKKTRGKTEAHFVLVRDGHRFDTNDSTGCGVTDLASFALRLADLTMRLPKKRRVIILDEPFKQMSVEYRPNVRRLIEVLSEEMCVQFIISTHMKKSLKTGTVYEL